MMDDFDATIPRLSGEELVVTLFKANNAEGKAFYAYIQLTTAKLDTFYRAQEAAAPIDLNALGTVLHTGWGDSPPPALHQQMLDEYGDTLITE